MSTTANQSTSKPANTSGTGSTTGANTGSTTGASTTKSDSPRTTTGATGATGAAGSSTSTNSGATPLNKLVETPEFAWFAAHGVALVSYLLGFIFRHGKMSTFLSKLFFLAEFASFALIIAQKYGTKVSPGQLSLDDNAHYLGLSLLWLIVSKRTFSASPFAIYSLFHALTYVRAYLLPALGYSKDSSLNKQIESFIKSRNNQFTLLAAQLELGLLISLFFSLFRFHKGNFLVFFLYAGFFRYRYAVSPYTRQAVHSLEVQLDNIANNAPPAVKDNWLKAKSVIAKVPGPTKLN